MTTSLAQRFKVMADKLDTDITYKRRVRTEPPTRKRMQEESYQRDEADRMEIVACSLRALAVAHETGTVPAALSKIKTRTDVELLQPTTWSFYRHAALSKIGIHLENYDDARAQLLALAATPNRDAERKMLELERKAKTLIGQIPGFFPTPRAVAMTMIDFTQAHEGANETILEPSGGSGALLDVIKEQLPENKLITCEQAYTLSDMLTMKGYDVVGDDFLAYTGEVDHVIMNPPFEKGQDAQHVKHAYELLKPGGSLVSVVSDSVKYRTDGKYRGFKEWVEEIGGYYVDLSPTAFKESGTGVRSHLLVVESK